MLEYCIMAMLITLLVASYYTRSVEYMTEEDRTVVGLTIMMAPLILPILIVLIIAHEIGRFLGWALRKE